MTRRKEEEIPRATWALSVLNGKWKLKVLVEMRDGPVRISELQRNVAGATKKMLIDTLHALEAEGIVERKEFEAAVRHVEYGIMPSLREPTCELIDMLADWSRLLKHRGLGHRDSDEDASVDIYSE
jgi:DNA-binding HxlR family transcriptional regulator